MLESVLSYLSDLILKNSLMNWALSSSFYRCGSAYLEKLMNLTQITQLLSSGAGTHVSLCFTYFINKF